MRGADVTQVGLFIAGQTADYVPAVHVLFPIHAANASQRHRGTRSPLDILTALGWDCWAVPYALGWLTQVSSA